MPKIIRPVNIAWMVFWIVMGIEQIIHQDWPWLAIDAAFVVWNWFRATREDMGGFI